MEYHRRQGDYSRGIGLSIKDRELTDELAAVEQEPAVEQAKAAVRQAIERRYTRPA